MFHTLYKTTNLINGRYYIGVHSTEDAGFGTDSWVDGYTGSGDAIMMALKKHGRNNFMVELLAIHESENQAYAAEAEMVTEEWLIENKVHVYNLKPGGMRGPKLTSKAAKKGHQTKVRNGTFSPPPKMTKETAKKIVDIKRANGVRFGPEPGKHHWTLSAETRRKMSVVRQGKTIDLPETTRQGMRERFSSNRINQYRCRCSCVSCKVEVGVNILNRWHTHV